MKRILAALFAAALVAAPAPTVDADDGIPIDMNAQYECLSAAPHLPADPVGDEITVRIALALDGVDEQTARDLIAKGEKPFNGVGVEHYVGPRVRFEVVDVEDVSDVLDDTTIVAGFITSENGEGSDLMSQIIRHYRVNRAGLVRDHVHLATSRDIAVPPAGNAVLGINNCLGSVGIPSLSYTIGEVSGDDAGVSFPGGLTFLKDLDAKTFAHELGHAFGGQHQYADCAENVAFAVQAGLGDVCTLMFNDASLIGMRFSPPNSIAARGYAEVHLAGAPSSHDH